MVGLCLKCGHDFCTCRRNAHIRQRVVKAYVLPLVVDRRCAIACHNNLKTEVRRMASRMFNGHVCPSAGDDDCKQRCPTLRTIFRM